jgi:hypothetical protein
MVGTLGNTGVPKEGIVGDIADGAIRAVTDG